MPSKRPRAPTRRSDTWRGWHVSPTTGSLAYEDYTRILGHLVEIPEALGSLERYVVINAIDHHWQEHLTEMEELRRSIGLRSYGQKDPLVEYKGEAYKYFEELMNNVRLQICCNFVV